MATTSQKARLRAQVEAEKKLKKAREKAEAAARKAALPRLDDDIKAALKDITPGMRTANTGVCERCHRYTPSSMYTYCEGCASIVIQNHIKALEKELAEKKMEAHGLRREVKKCREEQALWEAMP